MKIYNDNNMKICKSENYNSVFDKNTGFFARWGKTKEDDPIVAPAPEIADIEIVQGKCLGKCHFCSPSGTTINTPNGNVNIEDIKKNDLVLGVNIKTNQICIQNVEETYKRHYTGDLICIELENGEILKLTPDHLIILKDGTEKPAKILQISDEIITF